MKQQLTKCLEKLYGFTAQLEDTYTNIHDVLDDSEIEQMGECLMLIGTIEANLEEVRNNFTLKF